MDGRATESGFEVISFVLFRLFPFVLFSSVSF
jgi:hypothetical protein